MFDTNFSRYHHIYHHHSFPPCLIMLLSFSFLRLFGANSFHFSHSFPFAAVSVSSFFQYSKYNIKILFFWLFFLPYLSLSTCLSCPLFCLIQSSFFQKQQQQQQQHQCNILFNRTLMENFSIKVIVVVVVMKVQHQHQ